MLLVNIVKKICSAHVCYVLLFELLNEKIFVTQKMELELETGHLCYGFTTIIPSKGKLFLALTPLK